MASKPRSNFSRAVEMIGAAGETQRRKERREPQSFPLSECFQKLCSHERQFALTFSLIQFAPINIGATSFRVLFVSAKLCVLCVSAFIWKFSHPCSPTRRHWLRTVTRPFSSFVTIRK